MALASVTVGLLLYGFCTDYFSAAAQIGAANRRNIQLVRLGMDAAQVHRIMGPPQDVAHFTWPEVETSYVYPHRPGTSESYQIKVTAKGKVKAIYMLEE